MNIVNIISVQPLFLRDVGFCWMMLVIFPVGAVWLNGHPTMTSDARLQDRGA